MSLVEIFPPRGLAMLGEGVNAAGKYRTHMCHKTKNHILPLLTVLVLGTCVPEYGTLVDRMKIEAAPFVVSQHQQYFQLVYSTTLYNYLVSYLDILVLKLQQCYMRLIFVSVM
jgi:hypothetical protein